MNIERLMRMVGELRDAATSEGRHSETSGWEQQLKCRERTSYADASLRAVLALGAGGELDCCHTAAAVERVRAQHIVRSVEKIAGEHSERDPYWAGFSQACEEIMHRISDGECNPWEPA